MAIATTTFAERIARIERGCTVQSDTLPRLPRSNIRLQRRLKKLIKLSVIALAGCGATIAWSQGLIDVNSLTETAMLKAEEFLAS